MFTPSKANKPAPLLKEIEPRGKGMPPQPPTAKERSGGSTNGLLAEIKPK